MNYINHNQTKANVKIQWAKNGSMFHSDESFTTRPEDLAVSDAKVFFDYVAIRDISEGEELFLDYGNAWEHKWNEFVRNWESDRDTSSETYVSASEYNARYGKDRLRTVDEQLLRPYPDNLSTRCHSIVEESHRVFSGNISLLSDWFNWKGDNSGYACDILKRHPKDGSYWVNIKTENTVSKQVSNVPREAIKFADIPYCKSYIILAG